MNGKIINNGIESRKRIFKNENFLEKQKKLFLRDWSMIDECRKNLFDPKIKKEIGNRISNTQDEKEEEEKTHQEFVLLPHHPLDALIEPRQVNFHILNLVWRSAGVSANPIAKPKKTVNISRLQCTVYSNKQLWNRGNIIGKYEF